MAILLAVPAGALAKTGVSFGTRTEQIEPGKKTDFTIIVMNEPRTPTGTATPMRGVHPLVTFRSESGRVIRVRGRATDSNGFSPATVTFPDKGPWHSKLDVGGRTLPNEEGGQGFGIGTDIVNTPSSATPSPHAGPPSHPATGHAVGATGTGAPLALILAGAATALAALALVATRAGLAGRLRTRFGGLGGGA